MKSLYTTVFLYPHLKLSELMGPTVPLPINAQQELRGFTYGIGSNLPVLPQPTIATTEETNLDNACVLPNLSGFHVTSFEWSIPALAKGVYQQLPGPESGCDYRVTTKDVAEFAGKALVSLFCGGDKAFAEMVPAAREITGITAPCRISVASFPCGSHCMVRGKTSRRNLRRSVVPVVSAAESRKEKPMATNKTNKLDVRMRFVQTQAVELDCPALKERTALFGGRVGEYTTTHELFIPHAIVKDLQKTFRDPKTSEMLSGAIKEILEAGAKVISAGNPALSGAFTGAATVMQNVVGEMAGQHGVAEPSIRRPPPSTDFPPSMDDFPPPPDYTAPPFTDDVPARPMPRRSRKPKVS
jgi:hypothetical protein